MSDWEDDDKDEEWEDKVGCNEGEENVEKEWSFEERNTSGSYDGDEGAINTEACCMEGVEGEIGVHKIWGCEEWVFEDDEDDEDDDVNEKEEHVGVGESEGEREDKGFFEDKIKAEKKQKIVGKKQKKV